MTQGSEASVVVVTGATGMLGSATAEALSRRGQRLILVARNRDLGQRLTDSLIAGRRHRLIVGDLAEPDSVREVAEAIRVQTPQLSALIHTAAAFLRERQVNSEGHEAMFATNVLARYLLDRELTSLLETGQGRVIGVTGPSPDRLDFDDLMAEDSFGPFTQFRRTNAANLQLAFELARRFEGTSMTSNAYNPGALQSKLMGEMPLLVRALTLPFGRSAMPAAEPLADLALADGHAATNASFYKRGDRVQPPKASLDQVSQLQLWEECAGLLGIPSNHSR